MKVLKFGGSSVSSPERILKVTAILQDYYRRGEKFTVVFSAFGGVTDSLIEMANTAAAGNDAYEAMFETFRERHVEAIRGLLSEGLLEEAMHEMMRNHEVLKNILYGVFLVREVSLRTMDYILSFGERNAAYIISYALRQNGIPASYLDARKIIKTDKTFGAAKVQLKETYETIQSWYGDHPEIQIVTGFIGSAKGGLTTTLGRGGSDYTAALIGAGLQASNIEIWTDVNGVLTADPRKVKKAFSLPTMTYAEAMEMSHFGAKVIYPPTLQPALQKKIPLTIKNTFEPNHPGTFISEQSDPNGQAVKGISSIGQVALLTLSGGGLFGVPGISGRLFGALAQGGVNVILITQGSSEHSISFAISPTDARYAKKLVEAAFEYEMERGLIDPIKIEDQLSIVAIIGENMRYRPGIAGRMFQALGKNGVNCVAIAQGSSELNISVVIPKEDETKALNALHEAFFLSDVLELHVFMVGVGLIGKALIGQIAAQNEFLRTKRGIEIKIVGLANTKKMLFNTDGIDVTTWAEDLADATEPSQLSAFVQKMAALNLSNSIFVDNTADSNVASYYEQILDHSISISTPNKVATSSSYLQYQRLQSIATKRGVMFLYETNVGAGLPVISTLKDLINSGDRILKIEGVLSGSLSFIFNNFNETRSFSSVVQEARTLGYTEPDPRIDLNGLDVRRKILILAREAGLPIEANEVRILPILPEAVSSAPDVDMFFEELMKADGYFEQLRLNAAKENKVLRMVAALEDGKTSIQLKEVDTKHPFYHLDGSDNMIVFTTERYKDRPLVVRGPGAGAEVTAAGVFAEIITIGNYLS